MKTPRRAYLAAAAAVLLVAHAQAQDKQIRSYALPDHGRLELPVPASWKDEVRQPPNRLPPTIVFRPDKGPSFEIVLTVIWPARSDVPQTTPEQLRGLIATAVERVKAQAVEKTIEVKELKGTSGSGYYFSVTDRAPASGEFKYMTQGMIRIGELVASFNILTNDGQSDVVAAAFAMVAGASHVAR